MPMKVDTLMECDQMRFIFQHISSCCVHTSSIISAVLGSHWSKKSSTAYMTSLYKLFSSPSNMLSSSGQSFLNWIIIFCFYFIFLYFSDGQRMDLLICLYPWCNYPVALRCSLSNVKKNFVRNITTAQEVIAWAQLTLRMMRSISTWMK